MNDDDVWKDFTKTVTPIDHSDRVEPTINSVFGKNTYTPKKNKETKRDLYVGPKKNFEVVRKKDRSVRHERTLDLHGYTLQDAYNKSLIFLNECHSDGLRRVKIITGHGDGETSIKKEFTTWISKLTFIQEYMVSVCGGSYTIIIRKH